MDVDQLESTREKPSCTHSNISVFSSSAAAGGLDVVEAFATRSACVTVVAREAARPPEFEARLGISIVAGDATDPTFAEVLTDPAYESAMALTIRADVRVRTLDA